MRRPAAVAGSWYPSSPTRLRSALENYLSVAGADAENAPPEHAQLLGLIAPHAGLIYSGPVAAHAFRLLHRRRFNLIVLVGPSHYVPFEGVAVWPSGAFETPFGDVPVHEEAAAALIETTSLVRELPAAHAREHSLEMHLPFVAMDDPKPSILPLVMGHQTRATAFALGDALAQLMPQETLFVASSDLSHYLDARAAGVMDAQVIESVESGDAERLMQTLERQPDHACGGGPMVAVMRAASLRGANASRVLQYADSGDVSGDKSAVVGYMAAALYKT